MGTSYSLYRAWSRDCHICGDPASVSCAGVAIGCETFLGKIQPVWLSQLHLWCCHWPGSACPSQCKVSQCSTNPQKCPFHSHFGMKTRGVYSGHQSCVNTKVSHLHDWLPSLNSAFVASEKSNSSRPMEVHLHVLQSSTSNLC